MSSLNFNGEIKISEEKSGVTYEEISNLTKSVGWGDQYFETEKKWMNVIQKSSHIAYVKNLGRLIAFGRILEDGIMCMFYDVCVHPEFQKMNIGKLLMNHLIAKVKDKNYVSLGLFVWEGNPSATKFYENLGFEKSHAMELKRYMKKV